MPHAQYVHPSTSYEKTPYFADCAQRIRLQGDPNIQSMGGRTPLMGAVMKGHTEIAALLIHHGACVDTINSFGETALVLAEQSGHSDCAERLKQARQSKGAP
eukprot:6214468-Pleurochrysis_carterae.AAC.1